VKEDPLARPATYHQLESVGMLGAPVGTALPQNRNTDDRTASDASQTVDSGGGEDDQADLIALGPYLTRTRADEIIPARPVWLWRHWMVAGALHLLVGRQGSGKSTFAAWLVSQLSARRSLPGDPTHRLATRCAMLSLEEPQDRLVARLRASGADTALVHILGEVEDVDDNGGPFRRPWQLPRDCGTLEACIRQEALDVIVIDGLGYSVRGDSHNYAIVGSALAALAAVTERTGAAVIGLTHPPKGASDPVTAGIGSTVWTAIPRVTWILGNDPDDDGGNRRVVRIGKSAFREPKSGWSFTIAENQQLECGYATGFKVSEVSAEHLVGLTQSSEERGERAEARLLIERALADGPMESKELENLLSDAGISLTTLKRAKRDLGIRSAARRDPSTGRTTGWTVSLPGHAIAPEGHPSIEPLDTLGLTSTNTAVVCPDDLSTRADLLGSPSEQDGAYGDSSCASEDAAIALIQAAFGPGVEVIVPEDPGNDERRGEAH
jgi:AAA domain-containing protein